MTSGGFMYRRFATVLVALGLVASACTGSATVTQTGTQTGSASQDDAGTPVITPGDEPTAQQTPDVAVEPTAVPATEATPVPVPVPTPAVALAPAEFRTDSVVGISNDGSHAYAGTSSPWNDATRCGAPPVESLSVVNIAAAAQGVVAGLGAGLEQAGDVRQFLPSPELSAAVLSSCGTSDDPVVWLSRVDIGTDGRIVTVGERWDIGKPGESDPYLMGWIDNETIEARVLIEVDPENPETWLIEHRQISMSSGQTIGAEQFDYFDDDQVFTGSVLTTPGGFTYRSIADPAQRLGCEGFGVATTLELDDGTERRLALTQPDLVFSDVSELHLGPMGHIAWTSSCEGYVNAFVGKVLDDGRIADAHLIETYSLAGSESADYYFYRLTNDGFLAAVGQSYDYETSDSQPAFLYYDLSTDPNFINTSDPAPQIDAEPLFAAAAGDGAWHVGDTLSQDPACGGRTLYGKTDGGFVRAFPIDQEIDEIVDVDLGEIRTISYDGGDDFVSRTVVLQTQCRDSYEGRQVWFGTESNGIIWGLGLQQADLGEIAGVVAVRDVLGEGSEFVERSIIEVELLDGSLAEIELVALPFDS